MSQDSPTSEKQLRPRSAKKANSRGRKQNHFDLINAIPKRVNYEMPFDDDIDNIEFAQNCITFLKEVFPSRLEKLFFHKEFDDLSSLIGRLVDAITKDNFVINYRDDSYGKGRAFDKDEFSILYPVPWYDQQWFCLEAKYIERIPLLCRPLYAKLLYKVSAGINFDGNDFLGSNYEDESDSPFGDYDWVIDSMLNESERASADYDDDYYEKLNEILEFYKAKKSLVDKYAAYKPETIERFIPRNEHDEALKKLLIEGQQRDFRVWNAFAHNSDYYESCEVPYEECLMVFWDSNHGAEGYIMQMNNDRSREGGTCPMGYYNIKKNKLHSKIDSALVVEFQKVQDFIMEIAEVLQNYPPKNQK